MSSSSEIAALLKKTTHYDKDERYMALSDLCELLKKQLSQQESSGATTVASHMDLHTERDICTTILRLLHDKSNDVQAIAVKTLGVLILTIQNVDLMNEIANSLLDQIIDVQKMELRDIYTAGLRTLIQTCQASMGPRISQRLMARLIEGIRSAGATTGGEEMMVSCLDIIYELIVRFGPTGTSLVQYHEAVLYIGLQLLITPWNHPSSTPVVSTQSVVVKKRAGNVLACLASVLSEPLLQQMVNHLLQPIEMLQQQQQQHADTMDTRSLIRTMCAISGTVGHRFSQEQIDRMVPIFLRFTDPQHALTGDDEEMGDVPSTSSNAHELREACFIGYASFILHCPNEIQTHLPNIICAALAYMRYDPNYSYGNTNDDAEEMDEAGEEEDEYEDEDDEEEEEEEEDDDDDESWKVRRSAIRTLRAIVDMKVDATTQTDRIRSLWHVPYATRPGQPARPIALALLEQFKEREENCRVDIIDCFTRLLHNTIEYMRVGKEDVPGRWHFAADAMEHDDDTTIYLQRDYAPTLVKACATIIGTKGNDRSKSAALALLATLCQAPGGVGTLPEIQSVFAQVQTFLQGGKEEARQVLAHHRESSSKALQLDALSLSVAMLANANHNPIHIRQCLTTQFLSSVCQLLQEQWYKVIAEALRVISQIPKYFVIGYDHEGRDVAQERTSVASQLYTAIEPLLAAHDVDPEIKDGALKACALLLQSLHGSLTLDQTTQLLKLLLDRLMNETTRIAAIKTFISIAGVSTGGCHLDPILADSITTLASFLRLQSRSVKQSALEALEIVIRNHGQKPAEPGPLYASVIQEIAPLISDKDLHLCHLSLCTVFSILSVCPAAGISVKDYVLDPVLLLSTSSLLQGPALDSLLTVLKQMIVSNAIDFPEFHSLLREKLTAQTGKHGMYILSKCIAAITASSSLETSQGVLNEIASLLDGFNTPGDVANLSKVHLSLLISGDLGRVLDLSTMNGLALRLKDIYIGYFESSSEELKNAAAYALGSASVGSPDTFLQAIVGQLDDDNKKHQYLLLSSLREFIQCSSRKVGNTDMDILTSLSVVVPTLERHCSDEEEGVRTMVAECLGSLTCAQPDVMLKTLEEWQTLHYEPAIEEDDTAISKNGLFCWTIATAVKLAISGKVDASLLSQSMSTFVKLLQHPDLHVRNAALLMIYSAVHHMPTVVSALMKDSIMPSLYEVAKLKLERKVDLGPFTHTVDDALPLRKTALSIFATCLESVPGSVDVAEFILVLTKAFGDAEDIQLHAHQILISMCSRQSSCVMASLEAFVDPLEKTINKKPGEKTGTELERLNDWIKSALRVMMTLGKLDGAMNSRKFAEFYERVKGNSKFSSLLSSLEEER